MWKLQLDSRSVLFSADQRNERYYLQPGGQLDARADGGVHYPNDGSVVEAWKQASRAQAILDSGICRWPWVDPGGIVTTRSRIGRGRNLGGEFQWRHSLACTSERREAAGDMDWREFCQWRAGSQGTDIRDWIEHRQPLPNRPEPTSGSGHDADQRSRKWSSGNSFRRKARLDGELIRLHAAVNHRSRVVAGKGLTPQHRDALGQSSSI